MVDTFAGTIGLARSYSGVTRSYKFRTLLALEYGKSTNASADPTMFLIVFPIGLDVKKCSVPNE